MVFKFHNENSGRNRSPMRSVQSKRFGYLFNPWSDGKRVFKTATRGTISFRTMQSLAKSDEAIAARLRLFEHGVPEEFYDYENDPDALHNLIEDPKYALAIREHRDAMKRFMENSNDPLLTAFMQRQDPTFVSAYVDQLQAEADARRKVRPIGGRRNRRANQKLFQLKLPEQARPGSEMTVAIAHELPARLGTQKFHVTLKDATGKRLQRLVKTASGTGQLNVRFTIPADLESDSVLVSAFVGEDYTHHLLHRTESPVPLDR
jgi:N-sulfoglucosamine sulfohydrolase